MPSSVDKLIDKIVQASSSETVVVDGLSTQSIEEHVLEALDATDADGRDELEARAVNLKRLLASEEIKGVPHVVIDVRMPDVGRDE